MKRRPISALLVVLLLVAVGLVVWRRAEGPPVPDGFAVIRQPHGVEAIPFRLDEPGRVAVAASGSVGADGALEAYAWVLDRSAQRVVWRMSPQRARKAEGTRVVQRDTLTLSPGVYEVLFTPHGRTGEDSDPGQRMFDSRKQWRNDRSQWYVTLQALPGGGQPVRLESLDDVPSPPGLVWRSNSDIRGRDEVTVLEVTTPAVTHVSFVASEIGSRSVARVERLADGTVLWEAQASQARPAGGAARNRRVEADVRLTPGLYRLVARTSDEHGPRNWQANPPDDPRAWGLTLLARSGGIRPLDLWTGRTPLVRLRGDRPGAEQSARIKVTQPATVAVYGMGEFAGDANDYAWLENEATSERLWEQRRETTNHAGGDDKNRESQEVLTLAPGTYVLHFRTDDSHHLGDFNSDPPAHEERYGAALFLLGPEGAAEASGTASSSMVLPGGPEPPAPPEPLAAMSGPPPPAPPPAEGALAALVRVESNARRSAGFELRNDQEVRIYATGEFSGGSDYDAGWITNARGETVWRMSEARLRHAGGNERNQFCDEVVRLRGGAYTVHFTTDGSHAFGDFDGEAPAYPEAWGIIVTRAGK